MQDSHEQKIVPCLWFDGQAEEAANFYCRIFPQSLTLETRRYTQVGYEHHGQRPGSIATVSFELAGYRLLGLNGGPHFQFTPAISFFVLCRNENEATELWNELSEDGTTLMPFDSYPWSPMYGWLNDRFGVSWQVMLEPDPPKDIAIVPSLMFVGQQHGKAQEALNFYTSTFPNSAIGEVARYEAGGPDPEGTIKHARFELFGQTFALMESALEHGFAFSPATSLMVMCDNQQEVDQCWNRLSAVPEAEQCGWLADKFGVSWQIVPKVLVELLGQPEHSDRVMAAMLNMKKLEIEGLTLAAR